MNALESSSDREKRDYGIIKGEDPPAFEVLHREDTSRRPTSNAGLRSFRRQIFDKLITRM